eukprot:Hpha_TRINITY_DN15420_c2_g3::TRINITY_DN15420_c2_g3_i1::g.176913::m.176913
MRTLAAVLFAVGAAGTSVGPSAILDATWGSAGDSFSCHGNTAGDSVFVHSCSCSDPADHNAQAIVGLWNRQPPGGVSHLQVDVTVSGFAAAPNSTTQLRLDFIPATGYSGPTTGEFNYTVALKDVNSKTALSKCGPVEGALSGAPAASVAATFNTTMEVKATGKMSFDITKVLPITSAFFIRLVSPTPCAIKADKDCQWGCGSDGSMNISSTMDVAWS